MASMTAESSPAKNKHLRQIEALAETRTVEKQ